MSFYKKLSTTFILGATLLVLPTSAHARNWQDGNWAIPGTSQDPIISSKLPKRTSWIKLDKNGYQVKATGTQRRNAGGKQLFNYAQTHAILYADTVQHFWEWFGGSFESMGIVGKGEGPINLYPALARKSNYIHAETQAAALLNNIPAENGLGILLMNNADGPCSFCNTNVKTVLAQTNSSKTLIVLWKDREGQLKGKKYTRSTIPSPLTSGQANSYLNSVN